jgi:iron complex transport system permease protein
VLAGLAVALVAAFLLRTLGGDFTITLPDFIHIVTGTDVPGASYILMESKLPRAVLGVLVGGAFGVGGAIFQTVLRNPLASPDIVGVSIGASTAAVFVIVTLDQRGAWVSVGAVVGALLVAFLIRSQSGASGGTSGGNRLVLVGVGISAALVSVVNYLFTRADQWVVLLLMQWLSGSLNRADWTSIGLVALLLLVLAPVVAWLAGSGRVAELGEDTAAGLGVPPRRCELLLLVAVVLVALGVAAAGPVAFVAFLSGPIARALNGGRTTLAGAALVGAVIVVLGDYLGAYLVPDVNYPVGVITGAFGAPFLLWLLATGRTSRRS